MYAALRGLRLKARHESIAQTQKDRGPTKGLFGTSVAL